MIFFYISLATYFCFLILKFRDGLIVLEDSNYNLKDYIKNIMKNFKKLFFTPEILSIILIVIAIQTNAKVTGICFVIFYTLMFLYFLKHKKGTFKFKQNMSLICILVLIMIFCNVLFYLNYMTFEDDFLLFYTTWMYYIVLILVSYLSYFVLAIAQIINKPIELIFNKKHKL